MTGLPAEKLGLKDRGRVEEGLSADLVLFDPDTIQDKGDFDDPHRYPEGIRLVMVNGEIVVQDGRHTGRLPGKRLTRNGQ
jgi:N-acyl-D-aspartate/D-glutamate deacylase